MNDMHIEDEEVMYRAILRTIPNAIVNGKVTAAVFMDNRGGTSVDREGERKPSEVLSAQEIRFNHYGKEENYIGAATIVAEQCRKVGCFPVPRETKKNKFHAEIHESETIERITLLKAMQLSRKCIMLTIESVQ